MELGDEIAEGSGNDFGAPYRKTAAFQKIFQRLFVPARQVARRQVVRLQKLRRAAIRDA